MNGWEEVKLGEVFEIKHGWAFKGEFFSSTGKVIVLTPGNFYEEGGFRLQIGKEKFYLGEYPKEYLLKENDVVIAMTEQGPGLLGSPAIIPQDFKFLHNQRIGLVTKINNSKIHDKYIYYLFFTTEVRNKIFETATGTKVKHTAPKRIYQIKVILPLISTQQKIASILSAYDDLIENNLKRIKLLEETALRTYEAWFVKFKVNGEQLELNEETGLPEGWNNTPLGDLLKFQKGKKANEVFNKYKLGSEKLLLLDGIESGNYPFTDPRNQVVAERGDLIMLMDGARSSKVFFADRGVVGSTISKIIIFKANFPPTLLKIYFDYNFGLLQANNTGAAIPHANKTFINKMTFKMPPDSILIRWKNIVEPLYLLIQNIKDQNRLLKEARDILLPRLMTGVISV